MFGARGWVRSAETCGAGADHEASRVRGGGALTVVDASICHTALSGWSFVLEERDQAVVQAVVI